MLQRPKKRIWPLPSCRSCSNIRRHAAGEISGSSPSITNSRASACQKLSPLTLVYFFAGAVALLAEPPELRMALKKSDDGSSTSTSLFRLKLAL